MISTEKEGAQNFGQSCRWLLMVFGEGLSFRGFKFSSLWTSRYSKANLYLIIFQEFYIFFVFLAFNFYFLETCFVVNLWFIIKTQKVRQPSVKVGAGNTCLVSCQFYYAYQTRKYCMLYLARKKLVYLLSSYFYYLFIKPFFTVGT